MEARYTLVLLSLAVMFITNSTAVRQASAFDYYKESLAPTAVSFSDMEPARSSDDVADLATSNRVIPSFPSSDCDNACSQGCMACDSSTFFGGGQRFFGCDQCSSHFGQQATSLFGHGLIKPSDQCYNDFISPMTNPVFFEDPRTLTEARFIFLHHELPEFLGGNSVQVYALQLRVALSKRLSLIATKDGLIYTQSPVLDSGYADIAAGLKYNLFRKANWLGTVGFLYEAPSGSRKSLQGNGDGIINIFSSFGLRLGDKTHLISTRGVRTALDDNAENSVFYWSNHLDRRIGDWPLYALAELNWYNYLKSASAFPLPLEGGDLFNFGSPNVTGNDLVTGALGGKIKPKSNMEVGAAWEIPLTDRKGILDSRFTFDCIFRY